MSNNQLPKIATAVDSAPLASSHLHPQEQQATSNGRIYRKIDQKDLAAYNFANTALKMFLTVLALSPLLVILHSATRGPSFVPSDGPVFGPEREPGFEMPPNTTFCAVPALPDTSTFCPAPVPFITLFGSFFTNTLASFSSLFTPNNNSPEATTHSSRMIAGLHPIQPQIYSQTPCIPPVQLRLEAFLPAPIHPLVSFKNEPALALPLPKTPTFFNETPPTAPAPFTTPLAEEPAPLLSGKMCKAASLPAIEWSHPTCLKPHS